MSTTSIQFKLAQLRRKTDQELSLFIDHSLESALHLLDLGEPQRARVENSCDQAAKLLPRLDDLRERRRLKIKLAQVRERLERISVARESRVAAACS